MLHNLNEDCWLNILKYLGLKDKLALASVFESVNDIIKYQWIQLKDAKLDCDFLEQFKQQPGQLNDFLQCASESLQILVLSEPIFDSLRSYSFPEMRSLDWCRYYDEDIDEKVLLLTQIFPNLTKLTMHSSATGLYLSRWSQLQELHMISCTSLNTSRLPEILSTLPLRKLTLIYYGFDYVLGEGGLPVSKCGTLEELVIDDHHLTDFTILHNLMQLPHFRCLAFFVYEDFDSVFEELATFQPLRVESLLLNEHKVISDAPSDFILRMENLRRIVLADRFTVDTQYFEVCSKLHRLEQLHLLNVRDFPNTAQLWELAEKRTLNLINLSGCHIDQSSFQLGVSVLNRVLEKRTSPITLNLHNTNLPHNSEMDIEVLRKHENLKISFKPIDFNLRRSGFTEIQFYLCSNELLGAS